MSSFFHDNKAMIRKTGMIMVPVIIQNILIYSLNMIDSVMLSSYGQSEFAASSLANQAWFIYTIFSFGLSTGTCILVSQYFAKRDKKSISTVMAIGFGFSVVVSVLFAVILEFYPHIFLKLYTNDANLILLGSKYLKIIAPSYLITSFSVLYSSYLKSVEKAAVPLIFNSVSILVNTGLNYIFIFGALGIPKMGIEGAAIATVIARVVELIIMLLYFKKYEEFITMKIDTSRIKVLLLDFMHFCAPVLINEFLWGVGTSFQTAVFGRMGETVVNAVSVNSIVERMGFIVCMGLYQAASVVLGVELGRNNFDTAKRYSKYYMIFSLIFGIIFGIIMYLSYPLIVMIFKLPHETAVLYKGFCFILSILLIVKSINVVGICSILRSGGDTKVALFIDISIMLLLTNPLGAFLGLKFHWSPVAVYAVFILEEFIKMPVMFWRVKKEKWLRNITN